MQIVPISQQECKELLTRVRIGRLACCFSDQPYVVPVSYAYEPECLYLFSTTGQKIKWMRKNPKVCLQADEVGNRFSWTSVVINGTYLELREPQYTAEKERAKSMLAHASQWWLTPMASRREQMDDVAIEPVFFRIDITSMTGLRGVPESLE